METQSGRRAPRYPFAVDVELTDLQSGIQIKERAKDLSLCGCGVSTATPFSAGTKVVLKVAYRERQIVAFGKVIYGRQDIGMGIAFTSIEPVDQKLLEEWFAEQPYLHEEDH
jgi:CDGSH-type Zn-finger protein